MSSMRLPPVPGEWLDRDRPLDFTFEGTQFRGYQGDTITSALWAAGQKVLGRSFKYHRPRGILSLANHDTNVLMQSGQQLNLRADVTPLAAGMELEAVNTFGGVTGDRASVLNFFSAFLPVGFYYKVFHNKRLFPLWERLIRQMTGLGRIDVSAPHIRTPKRYDFCDVLVIGAGGSGLSAAIAAGDRGADVVVVDENARAGGTGSDRLGGKRDRAEKIAELIRTVENHPRIRLYTATQAAGYYADNWIPLVDRNCLSKMRAKTVIVASGAYEQPAVFRNNDLPGVMLASAAQRLIYRYAVKPMHRAVVLTANSDGYRAALDLAAHGVVVGAIVDLRRSPPAPLKKGGEWDIDPSSSEEYITPPNTATSGEYIAPPNTGGEKDIAPPNPATSGEYIAPLFKGDWGDLMQAVQAQGIPLLSGHCIYEARPNPVGDGVASAVICPIDAEGKPQLSYKQTIPCDGILMSVGWSPAANLLYQAGAKMQFNNHLQQFLPASLPESVFACGRVNGVYEFDQKLLDGYRAGVEAVTYLRLGQKKATYEQEIGGIPLETESPSHPYPIIDHPQGKNFVDFDEDLQYKDFLNAAQEGFDNIELLKRYTTVGMSPSQGKHSNMNALRILTRITGKSPGEVGTTTARPFFHPVPLSHLAGRGFNPERQTPLHSRHQALGAQFMLAGVWQRPEYYPQPGKSREECIRQEVEAVRQNVGLIDVSTLGKLEIRGADAAEFLERVYTGRAKMKVGATRYALMVDETGVIIDDGAIARLGTEHFYFTTTSTGATNIYRELSRLNTIWHLDCGIVNLTGARSAVNLAGIHARDVLSQLTDLDLSGAAFPYLAVREAKVAGIPAILMRLGFVGEWGYEIHVAAEYAPALWDTLLEAGAAYDIRPFGVEAQRLLRLEKGHIIIGQDTDGLTTPREAGLEWAVKMDKPFFIGQRSLQIIAKRPVKQQLVGFILASDYQKTPPQECHLVIDRGEIAGRVTSIAFSPSLQKYIGLAYLKPELTTPGNKFSIRLSNSSLVTATVSPTPFYDPDNTRQQNDVAQRRKGAKIY